MTDDRLSAYVDGELDGEERAEVERLLAESPEARRELEQVTEVRQVLRGLPPVEPDVTPLRRPQRQARVRRVAWIGAAGAVAAVVVVVALVVSFSGGTSRLFPQLDDLVVRHAEASEVGEGSGFAAMEVTELGKPGMAPADVGGGMLRTAIYESDNVLQVMYSDGVHDVSVFQQEGELEGPTYRATMEGRDVTVFEQAGHVITVVADPGSPDMQWAVSDALPS